MEPEVAAALIAVAGLGLTAAVSVWQTKNTLSENAKVAAKAAGDQARLAAGTALLPARTEAYSGLWRLLDVGPREHPKGLGEPDDRRKLAEAMTAWYYPHGLLRSWLKADLLVRDVEEVSIAIRELREQAPWRPGSDDAPSG